jgi:hypothetical protein
MLSKMSFKPFSRKKRRRRSRPATATSVDQPQTRKHYLGTTTISSTDCLWPGDATVTALPYQASHTDDIAMNAIQISLAVLVAGSSLAYKLPFISPIAGLLLQALTMRDARVPFNSSDNVLTSVPPGSETM